jgi:tRNA1Val (adenine37-N6)-methyltransferase
MPNSYFRFKQFTIQQDRCAMKVCTDSCILGAWTARRLMEEKNILDIGSGTGLLAIMLAQKSEAGIDTVESDPDAAIQAGENISSSPWANRIRGYPGDVRYHPFEFNYDFIITNPPFYETDLHSPDPKKNKAKHDLSLTLEELISVIRSRLVANGRFSILLPYQRFEFFENLAAANDFFLQEKLTIQQTPKHKPFRSIGLFGFQKPENLISNDLQIKDEAGKYTQEFIDLMKDYYLFENSVPR